jgi:hypothetical protein
LLWILGLDIARRGRDGPQLTDTTGKVPKAFAKVLEISVDIHLDHLTAISAQKCKGWVPSPQQQRRVDPVAL